MGITYEDLQKANSLITTTNVKGKDYAEVPQRVKAFRSLFPEGTITTEMISNENGVCIFKAVVSNGDTVLGVGTAYEKEDSSYINKTSYIENCETSAVGRALGFSGFGIDKSIASAEEVANAILNQEQNESKGGRRQPEHPLDDPKITLEQAEQLKAFAEDVGITVEQICKTFRIKSLAGMTQRMRVKATDMLVNEQKKREAEK